mmetsp:Transcript_29340/g.87310  ORF Transcript_29340/g.87310 Transcript_29340/m.87310 type:complete len:247 (+) Transcript_29340:799-1539(+)
MASARLSRKSSRCADSSWTSEWGSEVQIASVSGSTSPRSSALLAVSASSSGFDRSSCVSSRVAKPLKAGAAAARSSASSRRWRSRYATRSSCSSAWRREPRTSSRVLVLPIPKPPDRRLSASESRSTSLDVRLCISERLGCSSYQPSGAGSTVAGMSGRRSSGSGPSSTTNWPRAGEGLAARCRSYLSPTKSAAWPRSTTEPLPVEAPSTATAPHPTWRANTRTPRPMGAGSAAAVAGESASCPEQ